MYLTSVKMAGFKSFVDPTSITVRSHMNAIVGPNGCGKSNIVDAIRWVIGESSAKQLRGQAMSDVIFNGTSQRKAVGRAMVELHFDNQEGRIGGEYAAYTDIVVRREVQRDGQSSYFLNGSPCRRRDILDVFLGTGLGPRSYSIIEQGMISQLIEAKPEELRHHLEEVAGISKYRERRRETENRIRHTQDNLDRLNDIREELSKQLKHLKRQANAATTYQTLKAQERAYSLQIKALQWQSLENKRILQQQKIQQEQTVLEKKVALQRDYEAKIAQLTVQTEQANDTCSDIQKHYYQLGEQIARQEQQIHHHQQQSQSWQTELTDVNTVLEELSDNLNEHKEQLAELTQTTDELAPQKNQLSQLANQSNQALKQAEDAMQAWQQNWDIHQERLATVKRQIEVTTTKLEHENQRLVQSQAQHHVMQEQLGQLSLGEMQSALLPLQQKVTELTEKLAALQIELQQHKQKIIDTRQAIKLQQQHKHQAYQERQLLEKELTRLSALQQAALGYDDQPQQDWLQQQALDNAPRLIQQLNVTPGWEKAVETVLGAYLAAVCVDNIDLHLNALAEFSTGQVALVEKALGTACDHSMLSAQVDAAYASASWLAGVYIADTLAEAKQRRLTLKANESVITREGLWMGKHWVRVAHLKPEQSGSIEREQLLEELQQKIHVATATIEKLENHQQVLEMDLLQQEQEHEQTQQHYQQTSECLSQAKTELNTQSVQLEHVSREQQRLQSETARMDKGISITQETIAQLKQPLLQLTEEEQQLSSKQQELFIQRDQRQTQLAQCREVAQQCKQQADEHAIRCAANENQAALLKQSIHRDERQWQQLTEKQHTLQKNLSQDDSPLQEFQETLQEKLAARLSVQEKLQQAQQSANEKREQGKALESNKRALITEVDALKQKLDELRLASQAFNVRQQTIIEQLQESNAQLQAIIDELPEEADITNWQEKLDTLNKRIQRLGPINLAAIDEYKLSEERKVYLDQQFDDLNSALETLQAAIQKIDRESKIRFKETFDKVNNGLQRIFPQVFGGGRASLELSDEDLLVTGILVKAQPPGKRNSSIHMLSGGEKALTAISLIFAMFQLNPAPFCILDEVDAPLDDLNVARFCRLVKEMSSKTQFLIISHNKSTIEKADHLMGVTMQEPGVSRLVAVDMQEALEMVATA